MTSLPFDPHGQPRSMSQVATTLGEDQHPLEKHLKRDVRASQLYEARVMYGPALAMRLATEDAMASDVGRLPGLPSSNLLKNTLRGDTIGFEDILNRPIDNPVAPKPSLHELAEKKFFSGDLPGLNDQTPEHAYL